jgi:hypothetical protein
VGQKRARALGKKARLNSILDTRIPFKYRQFEERILRLVTQRKLQECRKLREEELALEEIKRIEQEAEEERIKYMAA